MRFTIAIVMMIAVMPFTAGGQQPVYLDPAQPLETRINDLISKLTLEEKASLMCTTAPPSSA